MHKYIRKWENYLERKEMKTKKERKKERRTEIKVIADFIVGMN
jgi:hypothetical protein